VPISDMPDMTPTSLAADVAPRKAKLLKMAYMFLKEQKICYKMVKPIVRNRVLDPSFRIIES